MREQKKDKKEIRYNGYNVVFDDNNRYIDEATRFLLGAIESYASLRRRGIKIVFFNGETHEGERGVTFFFRDDLKK